MRYALLFLLENCFFIKSEELFQLCFLKNKNRKLFKVSIRKTKETLITIAL